MILVKINIPNSAEVRRLFTALGRNRRTWTRWIREAWAEGALEMFRSSGFGKWPSLKRDTIYRRGLRKGYYKLSPAPGVSAAYPPNTWTGRLASTVAGERLRGGGISERGENIRFQVSTRLRYAAYALDLRPIEGDVLEQAVDIFAENLRQFIDADVERVFNRGRVT